MKNKTGTYLVEFYDGAMIVCGNNYKPWYTHASEYALDHYHYKDVNLLLAVKSVCYSDVTFADDGGLKYCSADHYQTIIDEVVAKTGAQRPLFSNYHFVEDPAAMKKLNGEIAKW